MLEEKDLQIISKMMDKQKADILDTMDKQKAEILEQSAANMRVMLESAIGPQFNLLFEKLDAMEAKLIPEEIIENHEDRLEAWNQQSEYIPGRLQN